VRLDLSVNQGEFEPQCDSVKLLSLVSIKAEVDVLLMTANNNTRTFWQGSVGSVGV